MTSTPRSVTSLCSIRVRSYLSISANTSYTRSMSVTPFSERKMASAGQYLTALTKSLSFVLAISAGAVRSMR